MNLWHWPGRFLNSICGSRGEKRKKDIATYSEHMIWKATYYNKAYSSNLRTIIRLTYSSQKYACLVSGKGLFFPKLTLCTSPSSFHHLFHAHRLCSSFIFPQPIWKFFYVLQCSPLSRVSCSADHESLTSMFLTTVTRMPAYLTTHEAHCCYLPPIKAGCNEQKARFVVNESVKLAFCAFSQ